MRMTYDRLHGQKKNPRPFYQSVFNVLLEEGELGKVKCHSLQHESNAYLTLAAQVPADERAVSRDRQRMDIVGKEHHGRHPLPVLF